MLLPPQHTIPAEAWESGGEDLVSALKTGDGEGLPWDVN